MSKDQQFILLGALLALAAVALGAFGAHALKASLSDVRMQWFRTGAQYHGVQALGVVLVGICLKLYGSPPLLVYAGWYLLFGVLIFSGSLYTMAITNLRVLGAITPIGGVLLIAGWGLFAAGIYRGAG